MSDTERKLLIAVTTLRYIASRSGRPGWTETAQQAASDGLRVINDPELLRHYAEMCGGEGKHD